MGLRKGQTKNIVARYLLKIQIKTGNMYIDNTNIFLYYITRIKYSKQYSNNPKFTFMVSRLKRKICPHQTKTYIIVNVSVFKTS